MNTNLDKRYQKQEVKECLILSSFLHPLFKSLTFLAAEERSGAKKLLQSAAAKVKKATVIKQEPKDDGPALPELPSLPIPDELPNLSAV